MNQFLSQFLVWKHVAGRRALTAGAHKIYKDNCINHSTPYKEVKEAQLLLMKENGKPRRYKKW